MVLVITNIPTPYRIPLFNKLDLKFNEINEKFHVMFYNTKTRGKHWENVLKSANFEYTILELPKIDVKREFVFHFPINIIKEIKKIKPDYVYMLGFSLISLKVIRYCKRNRIPVMVWSGETEKAERIRKIRLLRTIVRKYIITRVNGFICYGKQAKNYLVNLGAKEDRIFIVINTVDTDFFKNEIENLKSKSIANRNRIKILFIGRLVKLKALDLMFAALSKIDNEKWELDIVGDGIDKEYFVEQKEKYQLLNVNFIGFKQKDELPKYYANSDIFVLPSVNEIFGLVMVEAATAGLPIVCSEYAGGVGDIILDKVNGFVVNPYNINNFKEALEELINNKELREVMGKYSKEIISNNVNLSIATEGFMNSYNYLKGLKAG